MQFEDDLRLVAFVFTRGRAEYPDLSNDIQKICADPEVTSIDFSRLNLIDTDLDDIFTGLLNREQLAASSYLKSRQLVLLDLSSEEITEKGLKTFLEKLQKGEKRGNVKVIPDVRNTIFRIGFQICSEFGEELQAIAPSVFAGRLRLVF